MKNSGVEVCSMCQGGSELDIGAGRFRDFDSDLYYGIPVCCGCGGLGIKVDSQDFKERVDRIHKLRFQYCPTGPKHPRKFPAVVRLQSLEALIKEVSTLFDLFGKKGKRTFAEQIKNGCLQPIVEECRAEKEEMLGLIKNVKPSGALQEATKSALLAAFRGKIEEAEGLFRKAIKKYPLSATLFQDYAAFLVNFRGSYEQAYPWFKKSLELEPKKTIYLEQAARCFAALDKLLEAKQTVDEALKCDDISPELEERLQEVQGALAEGLAENN